MNGQFDIPYILYLDFPAGSDNHLRSLAGIRRYASARGWDVVTLPREETKHDLVRTLCGGADGGPPPVGCVADASGTHHYNLPPRLFGNVPVVYLDPPKPLPWRSAVAVTCDNAAVAKAAFKELADAMPPCFAAVSSGSMLRWNKERIEAFRALCTEDGRELRVFPDRLDEPQELRIARLSKWLAKLPRRTGVFAANDATALAVAEAARTIPRHIPKELVVLGVDGESDAEDRGTFHALGERPGLSSVKLDFEFAGYLAAKTLGEIFATKNTKGLKDFVNSVSFVAENVSPVAHTKSTFGPLCILRRESTRGAGRRDPLVLKAVETIRREACGGLTAAALAESFPASRKHFEYRFREAMGHSVLDEILLVRLEKAQTLLRRREIPIGDIAGLCGFRTGIELRKLFRLRFHTSLRQWRKDHAPDSDA